jgi:hypothetical protein
MYLALIYFNSTYFCYKYLDILSIRAYTCKVKTGDLIWVPKTNARVLYDSNVYERTWCRILSVYSDYYTVRIHILHVYARFDATNNFPYRKYVQIRVNVHIRTIYDTDTYNIRHNTQSTAEFKANDTVLNDLYV